MKTFEQYLFEDKEDAKAGDPHEIFTACLCLLGKQKLNAISDLSQESMDSLIQQLQRIAVSGKLIGKNDSELKSMMASIRYEALCQAISAAKEIMEQWKHPLNYVLLTGRSWHSDVSRFAGIENLKKFGIDSYGMKDFNSSDIILCDKSSIKEEGEAPSKFHCLGVSLKKKGNQKSAADPTMLNRSVVDALVGDQSTPLQQKIAKDIDSAFSAFYTKVLSDNAEKLVTDDLVAYLLHPIGKDGKTKKVNSKYKPFLDQKSPEKELKKWLTRTLKSLKQDEWKEMLGATGIMCTHESRERARDIINTALGGNSSAFKDLLKIMQKQSSVLANALMAIIYKGDLKTLIKYNFDFGLCIGRGGVKKTKNGLVGEVGQAEYETIEAISKALSHLQAENLKPDIALSKKQKDFESLGDNEHVAAKLFLDLKAGQYVIANLEIRYKGSYTSSPQVFAVMSPEFKKYVSTGKW